MQILTLPSQLQRLEGILRRSLPLALPVYGAVLNINRGNPGHLEILVDSWPDFGAVLARPSGQVATGGHWWLQVPRADCYRNMQAAFYRDLGAYRALLETPGCQRWDAAFYIFGLQDGVASVSQTLARSKGIELEVSDYYTYYHPDPTAMPQPRLDPGVRVAPLRQDHVDLLNETWPYGGNQRSRQYLAELVAQFPSLCLQDDTGSPVSWVLRDCFGTGAHGYTVPAHRRRGYMKAAVALAAKRDRDRGFPTFGHTATRNVAMQRLQEELGHQRAPSLCQFVLHNPKVAKDVP